MKRIDWYVDRMEVRGTGYGTEIRFPRLAGQPWLVVCRVMVAQSQFVWFACLLSLCLLVFCAAAFIESPFARIPFALTLPFWVPAALGSAYMVARTLWRYWRAKRGLWIYNGGPVVTDHQGESS